MLHTIILGLLLFTSGSYGDLYDASSGVVDLTPSNFDSLVTKSDEIWLVEFYAPWCGHCRNLVPEYKKAAAALKGIVKVGAINADTHKSLAQQFSVSGFPTIKIFTGSKQTAYSGQRTAESFIDAALKAAKDKAYENLGKKPGSSSDKYGNNGLMVPRASDRTLPRATVSSSSKYGHIIPWIQLKKTTAHAIAPARSQSGHNIPWNKLKRTTPSIKSRQPQIHVENTTLQPTVTVNGKYFESAYYQRLKDKLFPARNYDDNPPKIVKTRRVNVAFKKI